MPINSGRSSLPIRWAAGYEELLVLAFLILAVSVQSSADRSAGPVVADFGRIGAATLGMSQSEVSAALRIELTAGYDVPADESSCYQLHAKGESSPKVLLMMSHDKLVRFDVYDRAIRTAAGVGIGSSETAVQTAYSGKVSVKPHFYSDGHYLIVNGPDGQKLLFETDGTTVVAFRSGREPQVSYVEGCL